MLYLSQCINNIALTISLETTILIQILNLREVMLLRFLRTETSDSVAVELANTDITRIIVTKDNLVRNLIVIF